MIKLALNKKRRLTYFVVIAAGAFALTDIAILHWRGNVWPASPSPQLRPRGVAPKPRLPQPPLSWSVIAERNIFNADGIVAEALGTFDDIDERKAVPTRLALNLIATIVHEDPAQSIAAFRIKDESGPRAYSTGQSIEGLAAIVRIRRGRVYIRVNTTHELQYVEIPQKAPLIVSDLVVGQS